MISTVVGVASIATVVGRTGPNATCLTIGEGPGCPWYVSGTEPAGFAWNRVVGCRVGADTNDERLLVAVGASLVLLAVALFFVVRVRQLRKQGKEGGAQRRVRVATVTAIVAGCLLVFPAGVAMSQPDPCSPGQGP
jgi:hypothetical protein